MRSLVLTLVLAAALAAPAAATEQIRWVDLGAGLAEAKRSGRLVLVDVQTDWCGWCRRMEKTTYADADVRDYVGRTFVAVKLDAEDDESRVDYGGASRTHRQFADSFRITGYPTTLFLAPDGALITRVPGYAKPGPFLGVLRYIGDGHYKTTSWDEFQRSGDADRP
jgi:thioredoxin-related protein